MRILLVGGGGFVGHNLAGRLRSGGHEVSIADRVISESEEYPQLRMDLCDGGSIHAVLRDVRPEVIYHLAAQSMVPKSWQDPVTTFDINLLGALRVLNAAAEDVPDARFIFIGSGEEYGIGSTAGNPFTEDSVCRPCNPYAVSKYVAGMMLEVMRRVRKQSTVHLRPLNHYGPGQREGFVIPDFCAQIARMEAGLLAPEMHVGNLAAQKDFLYIDDILDGYICVGEAAELPSMRYNLCSGRLHPIQEILDELLSLAKIKIKVSIDPEKYRPIETPPLIADARRMREDFNWAPRVELADGLSRTLDFWREKIHR